MVTLVCKGGDGSERALTPQIGEAQTKTLQTGPGSRTGYAVRITRGLVQPPDSPKPGCTGCSLERIDWPTRRTSWTARRAECPGRPGLASRRKWIKQRRRCIPRKWGLRELEASWVDSKDEDVSRRYCLVSPHWGFGATSFLRLAGWKKNKFILGSRKCGQKCWCGAGAPTF